MAVINNYTFAIAQKMGLGFKGFFNLFGICCTLVYIRYSKKYIPKNTIIIHKFNFVYFILCINTLSIFARELTRRSRTCLPGNLALANFCNYVPVEIS